MSQIKQLKTLALSALALGEPEVLEASHGILNACQAEHPVTGLRYNHGAHAEMEYLNDQTRRAFAQESEHVPVVYKVLSDVSNLRALNVILSGGRIGTENDNAQINRTGEHYADKMLAMIAAIYKEEIQKCGGQAYHVGGDEFGANVSEPQRQADWETARPEKLVGAINSIGKRVRELVEELGLQNIMHAKDQTNFDRRGVGISCGYALLSDKHSLDEMDKRFEALKNSGAFWKRREQEPGYGLPDIMFKAKINKRTRADNKRHSDSRVIPAERPDAVYQGFMEVQFSPKLLASTRAKIDKKYKAMGLEQRKLISSEFPLMQEPMTDDAIIRENPVAWINPTVERGHRMELFKKRQEVGEDESKILDSILALYEQITHPQGICLESPEQLVGRYQNTASHMPGQSMHLLAFDVQNFSGLNKKFGANGCNKIFNRIQEIVIEECVKTGTPLFSRPMGKGSKIYAMLPGLTNEQTMESIRTINQEVNRLVHSEQLVDLSSPRHRNHIFKQGVKLAIAALPLHEKTHENPQAIMHELETQLTENIRENTTFKGADLGQLGVIPFAAAGHSRRAKQTSGHQDLGR